MKPILYILINIILCVGFSENIQAQEVENPPEELADKTWYLTKMIIDEEEMPFTPNEEIESVEFVVLEYFPESTTQVLFFFCDGPTSELSFEGEEEFYMADLMFLMNMIFSDETTNSHCVLEENVDLNFIYYYEFWNNLELDLGNDYAHPFHFTYKIYQLENYQELIVTNDNGDKAYFQNIELSVQDNEKNSVTFYPNPAQEDIYIENLTEAAEIEVYTISGKKLLQQQVNSSTESINISNLSIGIYFYSFKQNGKKIKTGKLIKE